MVAKMWTLALFYFLLDVDIRVGVGSELTLVLYSLRRICS